MAGLDELGERLLNKYSTSTRLKNGISLQELVQNRATEFTLDGSLGEEEEPSNERSIDKLYEYDDFEPFINLDCLSMENNDEKDLPFEQLKSKMTPITEDGKVLKLMIREGTGDNIQPFAIVYYHYNAYFEFEEIPFDSSYLRQPNHPVRMQVGVGLMYSGFEISLMTMKAGEKARFLVEPEYAYGPLGAPPRILPNATILLEIELMRIVDCGEIIEEPTEMSEKREYSFEECYKFAKSYHLLGNDYFQSKNIRAAIDAYRKAERELHKCSMNSDDEENKYVKLYLKVCVNLCICFNHPKTKSPERVCVIAREAFHCCRNAAEKSPKLYFNLAKAQFFLSDFKNARKNLKSALNLEPQNNEINKLLKEIDEKQRLILDAEKITYQKALGLPPKEKKKVEVELLNDHMKQFELVLRDELKDFASSKSDHLELPCGFTKQEIEVCKNVCRDLGLKFVEQMICGKRSFLVKPAKD